MVAKKKKKLGKKKSSVNSKGNYSSVTGAKMQSVGLSALVGNLSISGASMNSKSRESKSYSKKPKIDESRFSKKYPESRASHYSRLSKEFYGKNKLSLVKNASNLTTPMGKSSKTIYKFDQDYSPTPSQTR